MSIKTEIPTHTMNDGESIKAAMQSDIKLLEDTFNDLFGVGSFDILVNAITTNKINLPDGAITSAATLGGTAQTLAAAIALGKEADLAGVDFALKDGSRDLLRVHATKGLQGMVGNIVNPLMKLELNQTIKTPFYSDDFTVTSAAAALAEYPSLRTCQITLTGGAKAGVLAGQYADVAGVYYPIVAVAGAVLTLEYDYDEVDPVAGVVYINTWRFAGKYAGKIDYARVARMNYFDNVSGLMRTMPAGFPAFQAGSDGSVGFVRSVGLTNNLGTANWRTDAYYTAWGTATGTAIHDQVGVDGLANGAVTLTDTDNAGIYGVIMGGGKTIVADTSTHTALWLIRKTASAGATPIAGVRLRLSGGNIIYLTAYVDPFTGELSSDSDATAVVRDGGVFWVVTLSVTNDGTNTLIRSIVFPAARATINGNNDLALTGSNVFDYPTVCLNTTVIQNPIYPQKTTVSDKFELQAKGNDTDGDMAVAVEFESFGVNNTDQVISSSENNFFIRTAHLGSDALYVKLHNTSLVSSGASLNDGTKHKVLAYRSGSEQGEVVDGELVHTATISESGAANTKLYIGHGNISASSAPFTGIVHSAMLYPLNPSGMEKGAI